MGKIYYLMGKSACGKDTLYHQILEKTLLKKIVPYTTRPMREGEKEGENYYFVTKEEYRRLEEEKKIIESRTYETVHGPWIYFTVDDEQIQLFSDENYLMIGTLESYKSLAEYFGKEQVVPLYLEVDDGVRLQRALDREKKQHFPKYKEMCRRFLADEEDFSAENLNKYGIKMKYRNENLNECLQTLIHVIKNR